MLLLFIVSVLFGVHSSRVQRRRPMPNKEFFIDWWAQTACVMISLNQSLWSALVCRDQMSSSLSRQKLNLTSFWRWSSALIKSFEDYHIVRRCFNAAHIVNLWHERLKKILCFKINREQEALVQLLSARVVFPHTASPSFCDFTLTTESKAWPCAWVSLWQGV